MYRAWSQVNIREISLAVFITSCDQLTVDYSSDTLKYLSEEEVKKALHFMKLSKS